MAALGITEALLLKKDALLFNPPTVKFGEVVAKEFHKRIRYFSDHEYKNAWQ